jgi:hypothetical protein
MQLVERGVVYLSVDVAGETHCRQLRMPILRHLLRRPQGLLHQGSTAFHLA